MSSLRRKKESREELAQRLIRETELALYIGMKFPERVPRIPSVEVGSATFTAAESEAFWGEVLGDVSHLYRFLRRNPHVIETPSPSDP